jgi:LPS export ABC transporter protein LptC
MLLISSCSNTDAEIRAVTGKNIGIEVARNIQTDYSLGGKAKARLTAPLMYRYQDTVPRIEFTESIHVDFYDDTLGVESTMDAKFARYLENENKVYLRDSVRIINRKGDTLYCNELYWDRSRTGREFYTDKPVRIRTRTEIIDGQGMESSQDFKEPVIRNITGIITLPASDFPQ